MNGDLSGAGQTNDRMKDIADMGGGHATLEVFQTRNGQGPVQSVFVVWVERFGKVIQSAGFARLPAALQDLEMKLRKVREEEGKR